METMMHVNKKGCKELLMHRMFFAIVSSIAVQFLLVTCLILITNLSTDYALWLQNTLATVTSLRMWSYFCILATVTFFQGIICSKSYLSTPKYLKSRFIKFCGIFTSQNILLCILHIVIGGLMVWLHLSVKGGKYSSLTVKCSTIYGTCLVEEHYFLLLSGFWTGLYLFINTTAFHVKYLKFPIISLSKFFRFKTEIYSMLPSVMINSIWPTLYYLCGYYFMGSYCRGTMLFLTSTQLEVEPLDCITRLMNLSLVLHIWLYQLIFKLTINSMYLLFELYLTKWVSFEFKQSNVFNNNDAGITLPEVLSMDKIPIMQHLGYLDLVILAQKQKARRNIIFTLSQPGGHPYNWNCIVEKCIDCIMKFSNDLSTASVKIQEPPGPVPSGTTQVTDTLQKQYLYHMRSLMSKKPCLPKETYSEDVQNNKMLIQRFITTKWQGFLAYLLSKPLINYIFGELEGNRVCHILFHGQCVIWAAEAISSLSVLSLNEDSYGIVQKDLPVIIDTLLGLKQALDKLQKSSILIKKQEGDDKFIKQIVTSLRAATKRSLYRIVTNFEMYINDLALESTTLEQLHNFLSYRE